MRVSCCAFLAAAGWRRARRRASPSRWWRQRDGGAWKARQWRRWAWLVQEVCALLALRSTTEGEARSGLEQHLRALKVDTQKTALDRLGGQVVYVLGGEKPTDSQLWVYKESFLPARIRFTDEHGVAWDVRFSDYASPATGGWFPRLLEVSRDSDVQARFTTVRGDSHASVPERLF